MKVDQARHIIGMQPVDNQGNQGLFGDIAYRTMCKYDIFWLYCILAQLYVTSQQAHQQKHYEFNISCSTFLTSQPNINTLSIFTDHCLVNDRSFILQPAGVHVYATRARLRARPIYRQTIYNCWPKRPWTADRKCDICHRCTSRSRVGTCPRARKNTRQRCNFAQVPATYLFLIHVLNTMVEFLRSG